MIAWSSLVSSVTAWKESHWQLPLLGWNTITLAAVSTALVIYLTIRDRSGLPGPIPLPMFGSLPGVVLSGSIVAYLDKMREKYGDVSIRADLRVKDFILRNNNSAYGQQGSELPILQMTALGLYYRTRVFLLISMAELEHRVA